MSRIYKFKDIKSFLQSRDRKILYCSQIFVPRNQEEQKCLIALKKPILQNPQAGEALKVLENNLFNILKDSTALFNEKLKKLMRIQRFCIPAEQKCCIALRFLCLGTRNFETGQHFFG